MTQEFQGPVGDVAGRDVIKYNHVSRLLTKDERRTLNNLVRQLTDDFGESGQQTWTSIHRILGIDNTEAMHLDHYKPTEAILQLLLENAGLRRTTGCAENDTAQCKVVQSSIATERKRLLASIIVAGLASVSAVFCAHQAQASAAQAKEAVARSRLCQFEGKHYSIGSVMNSQNLSHVECVSQDKNLPPVWKAMAIKD